MFRVLSFAVAFFATSAAFAQTESLVIPADDAILKILKQRVDEYRWATGVVVGVIEPGRRSVVAYGERDKGDPRPLDGNTVFEIGSITKPFTSILLADAVRRGDVALDDPVEKYLPDGIRVPERGRKITLHDLATHFSSLPRIPNNLPSQDDDNPYKGYTEDLLYNFLRTYELTRDVGSRFEYSNLAYGLLGLALARRAGTDYESLLRDRITGPLGLSDTTTLVWPNLAERMAVGHSTRQRAVAPWDMPVISGAGALRSTVNDLLTLLSAQLGYMDTPLAGAMKDAVTTRRVTGDPRAKEIGLGWLVYTRNGKEIIGHGGDTVGFQSAIAFDPVRRAGVVVLSNTSSFRDIADISLHLLDSGYSLDRPAPVEISIQPEIFDRYAGTYELAGEPKMVLTLSRENNQFFVQANGQGKLELFAENAQEFFLKATDARISFELDGDGRANSLVLHQNGEDEVGKRIQ